MSLIWLHKLVFISGPVPPSEDSGGPNGQSNVSIVKKPKKIAIKTISPMLQEMHPQTAKLFPMREFVKDWRTSINKLCHLKHLPAAKGQGSKWGPKINFYCNPHIGFPHHKTGCVCDHKAQILFY
jgi:hypothetical protein